MADRERWQDIKACLDRVGADFAALVKGADPDRLVTEHWSVAETAAHVTAIAAIDTAMLGDEPEFAFPELTDTWLGTTVESVHEFNARALRLYRERGVPAILDRFDAELDAIRTSVDGADPLADMQWLGDSRVTVAGLLAHLINELQIHGLDIARATGQKWTIEPLDASHFHEAFLVEMIRRDYGHLIDGGAPPRERRVAVQFRSAYTTPVTFALQRGRVTVEEPRRDNDVRVTFDPVTMNLWYFGRVSMARAAVTGKMRLGGPRPWLLPQFLRKMRLPNGPGSAIQA